MTLGAWAGGVLQWERLNISPGVMVILRFGGAMLQATFGMEEPPCKVTGNSKMVVNGIVVNTTSACTPHDLAFAHITADNERVRSCNTPQTLLIRAIKPPPLITRTLWCRAGWRDKHR